MASDGRPDLLRTKLYVPRPREGAVRRDRLLARLDEAWHRSLTLVSAPAGSGKTSLVAAWLERTGVVAGWLSLDPGDDDAGRFWAYLVEAFRVARPGIGWATLQLVDTGARLPAATLAGALINEVAASDDPLLCVLDDLHVIESAELNEAIHFLVANAPQNLHLVATSRADPPWPLARLRATGRMAEIRAADLRFSEAETSELLERAGSPVSDEDVQALNERTLGWVAGVQMAAISMRGRDDPSSFITDFAGSHRFILDYLTEEVLARQPAEVVSFLELTSVPERLTGSLCDALTGGSDGEAQLRRLEQDNAFIDALDDERSWYRYHPLLTDVLRTRLRARDPDLIRGLHVRASSWFEQRGLTDEAIEHALLAGDHGSVARILHATAAATFMVNRQQRLLGWADRLPEHAIERDPQLALMCAWARFVVGDMEGIDHAVAVAGDAVGAVADQGRRTGLDAQLGAIRAWIAYQQGEVATCVELARASAERLPDDALVPRQTVTAALGAALLLTGELDEAERVLRETRELSRRDHDRLSESLGLALAGIIALERGSPELARSVCLSAVEVGTVAGEPLPSVGIARVVLGEVLVQAGQATDAMGVLIEGIATCEAALGQPEWVYEGLVALARAELAAGDPEEARRHAQRADELFETVIRPSGMEPLVHRAQRDRARYAAAAGQGTGPAGEQPLVEPLNQRELEVVRLLAERRSNREIADALYLSVNTVKWHARNLYGKLGVERRRDAVERARELGIL